MNDLYNKEFYEVNSKDIVSAEIILPYVLEKLKIQSIVDFGCGSGTWLKVADKFGVNNYLGIDGEYVEESWQLIDKKHMKYADISDPLKINNKYDLAISLEVAEHIDEKKSDIYIDNLVNASDIILFSAAIPNQEGTNHINEQYPSYWQKKFNDRGYTLLDCLRQKFWDNKAVEFWYKQNIMLYVKKEKAKEISKLFENQNIPIDLVHPEKLEKAYHDFEENKKKMQENIEGKNQELKILKNDLETKNVELNILKKDCEEKNKNILKSNELINKQDKIINYYKKIYKPKISIIVPTFNVIKYIKECLDSILNQSLKEIEVICGDGGSTDGTLEVLKEYERKDERVKIIHRDKSGYGQSVNECMDNAIGEYIGIVESDDKIREDMCEKLYEIAIRNDLDWVKGNIYYYYSENNDEKLLEESITYGRDIYNKVLDPNVDIDVYKTGLRTWAGIYKKSFLNKHNIRHNETPGGSYQDVGFYLKTIYYARRVFFLDDAFYMWRQDNPNSSIHYDAEKLVKKSLFEWKLNRDYLKASKNTNQIMWEGYNYRKFYSYLWTIDLSEESQKKELIQLIQKEFKEDITNGRFNKILFDDFELEKFNNLMNL